MKNTLGSFIAYAWSITPIRTDMTERGYKVWITGLSNQWWMETTPNGHCLLWKKNSLPAGIRLSNRMPVPKVPRTSVSWTYQLPLSKRDNEAAFDTSQDIFELQLKFNTDDHYYFSYLNLG